MNVLYLHIQIGEFQNTAIACVYSMFEWILFFPVSLLSADPSVLSL